LYVELGAKPHLSAVRPVSLSLAMSTQFPRIASAAIAMGIVALSALLKFSDLSTFVSDLREWRLAPAWAVGPATILVPGLELTLAGLWFAAHGSGRYVRLCAVAMLVAWSGAYVIETIIWGPPKCGCFGRLREWYLLKQEAPWVIGRNLLLILMLLSGTELAKRSANRLESGRVPAPAAAPGFTLIETILVVALLGVLVALFAPALSGAKGRAYSARTLSDLRTHSQTIGAYAADFKESFPCIFDPKYTHTVVVLPDSGTRELFAYFDQRFYWWMGLAEGYYNGDLRSAAFYSPKRGTGGGQPYYYSDTCLARPEYWNLSTRTPRGQIGPMRLSDVVLSGKKGVFASFPNGAYQFSRLYSSGNPEAAFCDGSCRVVRTSEFTSPVPDGDGPPGWPYACFFTGDPIMNTVNGVRGRDVR
jgi:prepilin-type N-terminal cleavage/methylation domain-containing protein